MAVFRIFRAAVPIGALLTATPAALAQTTNCSWIGSTWVCNSRQAPPASPTPPPIRGIDAGGLLQAFRQGREDRTHDDEVRVEQERSRQNYQQPSISPPQSMSSMGDSALPVNGDAFNTGNGLLATCQNTESWALITCLAFIRGTLHGFQAGLDVAKSPPEICIPVGADLAQLRDVVVKWLTDHPETRHMIAEAHVIYALKTIFKCK